MVILYPFRFLFSFLFSILSGNIAVLKIISNILILLYMISYTIKCQLEKLVGPKSHLP